MVAKALLLLYVVVYVRLRGKAFVCVGLSCLLCIHQIIWKLIAQEMPKMKKDNFKGRKKGIGMDFFRCPFYLGASYLNFFV